MNHVRSLVVGMIVVLCTVLGHASAHAQRRMLVLIDASGSMTLPRPGDLVNPTRFHAAKTLATRRVLEQ